MKKIICGVLFGVGVLSIFGIIGGTECGAPLSNVFWCFPIMLVMWVLVRIGRLFKIEE